MAREAVKNVPTLGKDVLTLRREGWITEVNVLAPEHDAAHVKWGGKWRMPTDKELSDLRQKCDWTWTKMEGVDGYVVRGRGEYASASIFLPAAGNLLPAGYGHDYAGSYGCYWSSYSGGCGSWNLYFDSSYRLHYTHSQSRTFGYSVRPLQGFTE